MLTHLCDHLILQTTRWPSFLKNIFKFLEYTGLTYGNAWLISALVISQIWATPARILYRIKDNLHGTKNGLVCAYEGRIDIPLIYATS